MPTVSFVHDCAQDDLGSLIICRIEGSTDAQKMTFDNVSQLMNVGHDAGYNYRQ
jgi:hypothetical protein